MLYSYYYIEQNEEHMLFASEIAKLFGIYSSNGNYHSVFVSKYIDDYIINKNIKDYKQLYYMTSKKTFIKVYPKCIYLEVIKKLIKEMPEKNLIYEFILDNKKFKVKRI